MKRGQGLLKQNEKVVGGGNGLARARNTLMYLAVPGETRDDGRLGFKP